VSDLPPLGQLPQYQVYRAVSAALDEDLGLAGDITTLATIDWSGDPTYAEAVIIAREAGRIAGLQFAEAAFRTFDHDARIGIMIDDGGDANAGDVVARIRAKDRALLTGERVALNFLCHLSGIATQTRQFVKAIDGTGAHICCTRKTTPGLRAFEKYAVRAGGGMNHRFGLFDAVLIKDNHIVAAGGIANAIERARAHVGHMVKVEVEVATLEQLDEALKHRVDVVLFDNMDLKTLAEAVKRAKGKAMTEASGGVTLETVRQIAETGVDMISSGALTHSSPALDLALDFLAP
jgi:nicotinate-nucleotide pyrophosphorylase (carboxylating)